MTKKLLANRSKMNFMPQRSYRKLNNYGATEA